MATPEHQKPQPRGHEIYNFGKSLLGHHNYVCSLSDLMPGSRKEDF